MLKYLQTCALEITYIINLSVAAPLVLLLKFSARSILWAQIVIVDYLGSRGPD